MLHLTSCTRASDIPPSVFRDLAERIDRGGVLILECRTVSNAPPHGIILHEGPATAVEHAAIVEALRAFV